MASRGLRPVETPEAAGAGGQKGAGCVPLSGGIPVSQASLSAAITLLSRLWYPLSPCPLSPGGVVALLWLLPWSLNIGARAPGALPTSL